MGFEDVFDGDILGVIEEFGGGWEIDTEYGVGELESGEEVRGAGVRGVGCGGGEFEFEPCGEGVLGWGVGELFEASEGVVLRQGLGLWLWLRLSGVLRSVLSEQAEGDSELQFAVQFGVG